MPRCLRLELADVAAWPNLEAALWLAVRRMKAWAQRCRSLAQAVQQGLCSEPEAQARAEALRGLCLPAQPGGWQRSVLAAQRGFDEPGARL